MRNLFLILICLSYLHCSAQDSSIFKYPIEMDAVVISAKRSGWDVDGFIKRVQNDTTFYKAFRSMRMVPYTATNNIKVLNKRGKVDASYYSITKQHRANGCRTMETFDEKVTGKFYDRDGEYRYYTAELYDYLFFTKGTVCGENDIIAGSLDVKDGSQIEKHKQKLKMLIFNPGSKIGGVPFMGEKAAIFEPEVAKMYNFKLASEEYDGEDCYVFKAVPKEGYEDDVVYRYLATCFRKSDYSIVARDYSLTYSTLVYDFDVNMKVRTKQVGEKLLPTKIIYDGNWHVFTQRRERVKFTTTIVY